MPLSLILSGLLAASAGMYGYLEYTTKTSQAKERIKEADKMEYMALKSVLSKSISQDDSDGLSREMDMKMSSMIASDTNISRDDMLLVDKLQSAIEHMMIKNNDSDVTCLKVSLLRDDTGSPYMSQAECNHVSGLDVTLYDESSMDSDKINKEVASVASVSRITQLKNSQIIADEAVKLADVSTDEVLLTHLSNSDKVKIPTYMRKRLDEKIVDKLDEIPSTLGNAVAKNNAHASYKDSVRRLYEKHIESYGSMLTPSAITSLVLDDNMKRYINKKLQTDRYLKTAKKAAEKCKRKALNSSQSNIENFEQCLTAANALTTERLNGIRDAMSTKFQGESSITSETRQVNEQVMNVFSENTNQSTLGSGSGTLIQYLTNFF